MLKTVPGEVWLTETGGITTFAARASRRRPRAPRRPRSTCSSSPTASTPRSKGYKSKVTRIYVYRWWGEPDGTFDSGLVNPDGSPRPAFAQFKKYAKHRLK